MRAPLLIAVLGALVALAAPSLARTTPKNAKAAAQAYAKGAKLFDEGDYLGAIESFERAYRLKPHYVVRCNLALCYERRSDFVNAAKQYRACLAEGAEKTAKAAQVRNSLKAAEARIAWVTVNSRHGGMVVLDGRVAGTAPKDLRLNPGTHVVEVRKARAKTARSTVTTRGGERLTLDLSPTLLAAETQPVTTRPVKPQPPAERRGLSQLWFWSGVGVTAVLAVAATVMGALTLQSKSKFDEGPTEAIYQQGVDRRLATNVLWGVTAAAAAGTTALFFFTDWGSDDETPEGARRALRLGVGVRGAF